MTAFKTFVAYSPPTPLGLIPGRWKVEHWCRKCHARVPTEDLIGHAMAHEDDDKPSVHDGGA